MDRAFSKPPIDPERKILRDLKGRRLSQAFFENGVQLRLSQFSEDLCMTKTCDVMKLLVNTYPPSYVERLFDPLIVIAQEIAKIACDSEYMRLLIKRNDEDRVCVAFDRYVRACVKPRFPVFTLSFEMLRPVVYGGYWNGAYVHGFFDDGFLDALVDDESLLELEFVCNKKHGHFEGIEFDLAGAEGHAEAGLLPESTAENLVLGVMEGEVLQEAKAMIASEQRRRRLSGIAS